MVLSLEDRANQRGELRVGTNFEERPRPHPVHRFDLGDEFDRPGELAGEQRARRAGVSGVRQRRRIREHRNRRGREVDRVEHRLERIDRAGDEPAVKGPRDAERVGRDLPRGEEPWLRSISAAGPDSTHCRGAFLLAMTRSRALLLRAPREPRPAPRRPPASRRPLRPLPAAVMSSPRLAASERQRRVVEPPGGSQARSARRSCGRRRGRAGRRNPRGSRSRPRLTAPIAG